MTLTFLYFSPEIHRTLYIIYLSAFIHWLVPQSVALHEGQDCSLLYPQYKGKYLAQSSKITNICYTKEKNE